MTIHSKRTTYPEAIQLFKSSKFHELNAIDCKALHQECCDHLGRNPLHYVSQGPDDQESAKIVDILLANVGSDSNIQQEAVKLDIDEASALHLAVSDGNYSVVKALLKYSFFVKLINDRDASRRTPIYYAYNNESIWDLLRSNGAKIDESVKLSDGKMPKLIDIKMERQITLL